MSPRRVLLPDRLSLPGCGNTLGLQRMPWEEALPSSCGGWRLVGKDPIPLNPPTSCGITPRGPISAGSHRAPQHCAPAV